MFVLLSNSSGISEVILNFCVVLKLKQLVIWNSNKHGTLAFYMRDKLKSHPLCFKENQNLLTLDSIQHKLPLTTAEGKTPTFAMVLKKVAV